MDKEDENNKNLEYEKFLNAIANDNFIEIEKYFRKEFINGFPGNRYNQTPLMCSFESIEPKVTEFILKNGADPNQKINNSAYNSEGYHFPIHESIISEIDIAYHEFKPTPDLITTDLLIKYGSDLNCQNIKGETPLDLCIGRHKLAEELIIKNGGKRGSELNLDYEVNFLTNEELSILLDQLDNYRIFDFRNQYYFNKGHIKNAEMYHGLNFNYNQKIDRTVPIVLYDSKSDNMLKLYLESFLRLNFKKIYILKNGYWDWQNKGFPVESFESNYYLFKFFGTITKDNEIVRNTSLTICHNLYCETTETDENGKYKLTLHSYELNFSNFNMRILNKFLRFEINPEEPEQEISINIKEED